MTLYRNILKSAWENTWKHKYLWFFGLFAALLGNGGELEVFFRSFNDRLNNGFLAELKDFSAIGFFSMHTLRNIGRLMMEDTGTMLLVIFILSLILILGGFLVWLVISSQIALVNNSANAKLGKKHDIQIGLDSALKNFWPVLSLNLIIKIVSYILFGLLTVPIAISLMRGDMFSYSVLFILLYIVLIPFILFFSFIIKYAIAYTIIKEENFYEALKSGWSLFNKNILISIEMAIILFFINLLSAFALVLIFLVLAVPLFFVITLFSGAFAHVNLFFIIFGAIILFIIFTAFIGAILATFQISSWTYLFIELETKGGVSKIKRIFLKK